MYKKRYRLIELHDDEKSTDSTHIDSTPPLQPQQRAIESNENHPYADMGMVNLRSEWWSAIQPYTSRLNTSTGIMKRKSLPEDVSKRIKDIEDEFRRRGYTYNKEEWKWAPKWEHTLDKIHAIGEPIAALGLLVLGGIGLFQQAKFTYGRVRLTEKLSKLNQSQINTIKNLHNKGARYDKYPNWWKSLSEDIRAEALRGKEFSVATVRKPFKIVETALKTRQPTEVEKPLAYLFSGPGLTPEQQKKLAMSVPPQTAPATGNIVAATAPAVAPKFFHSYKHNQVPFGYSGYRVSEIDKKGKGTGQSIPIFAASSKKSFARDYGSNMVEVSTGGAKIWNPQNKEHVEQLAAEIESHENIFVTAKPLKEALAKADYRIMEDYAAVNALKNLGYKGAVMYEEGIQNLLIIGRPQKISEGKYVLLKRPTTTVGEEVKAGIKKAVGPIYLKEKLANTFQTGKIHSLFTRFRGLPEDAEQAFVRISESSGSIQKEAVSKAIDAVGHLDKKTRDELQLHMDNPTYPLPTKAKIAKEKIQALQDWSFKELSERGYFQSGKWPQNKIDWCNEQAMKERDRLETLKTKQSRLNALKRISEYEEEAEKLKNLTYIHRVVKEEPPIVTAARRFSSKKTITSFPSHMMGRKYDTIDDLKKAGMEPEDVTIAVADLYDQTMRSITSDEFIKLINSRDDMSLPLKKAPKEWRLIDPRVFPRGTGKKYHPAIAEAIEELVATKDSHALIKAYDAVNTTLKMIGFYNPVIMPSYDIGQSWRLAGIRVFSEIPKAIVDFIKRTDDVVEMERDGLFNNVIDYKPALKELVNSALTRIHGTKRDVILNTLGKYVNPLHLLRDFYNFNNMTTWNIDRILRVAARRAFAKTTAAKDLSEYKITDITNDFMANYGKVPKHTRWALNRVMFTPTYKISMIRVLKRMVEDPKRFKASLFRHYMYKMFMRFALPAIVSAYVYQHKKKVRTEGGYRLVVKRGGGKERVYAFSGPLLEETKILHRSIPYTIKVNLAAIPHMLVELLQNERYTKNKSLAAKINSYSKIGLPGLRELETWEKSDRTSFENFMRTFGIAYVYERNSKPADKHSLFIKVADALDLWVDYKTLLNIQEKRHRYGKTPLPLGQRYRLKNIAVPTETSRDMLSNENEEAHGVANYRLRE